MYKRQSRLDEYSYPIIASELGRFRYPDTDLNNIESTFGYAYQFDSSLYAKFLRQYAEKLNVERIEGKVVDTRSDPENGHISELRLESGQIVKAELFVDCSGFRGLLIEQTLKSGYEDWSEWLPCNRAIAVPTASNGPLMPFTRATARTAGWQWRIPLQHRTGNGHVYCSEFISDEEARDQLLTNLDGDILAEPNQLYFKTGKRKVFWNKNVIAIGLSAGFLEPLESTSIYLIQEGITELLELFPDRSFSPTDMAEYNARMDLYFERVRDFLLLHYVATQRKDSEMWRHFSSLKLPDSLQEKIDAWTHRGHIIRYEFGAFLPPSWVAVMVGQNLLPRTYDRRVDKIEFDTLKMQANTLRQDVLNAAQNTPDHSEFLNSIGAAIPMDQSAS